MASWAEIADFLGEQFILAERKPDSVAINFRFDDGRTQTVFVWHLTDGMDEDWLQIESPFASIDQVNILPVLRELEQATVGGLGVVKDTLTLRHSSLMRTVDADELLIPIRYIATGADLLESKLGQDVY